MDKILLDDRKLDLFLHGQHAANGTELIASSVMQAVSRRVPDYSADDLDLVDPPEDLDWDQGYRVGDPHPSQEKEPSTPALVIAGGIGALVGIALFITVLTVTPTFFVAFVLDK